MSIQEPLPCVCAQDDASKLNAWGYMYYKGERVNEVPKRIASVWKYGWLLRPAPQAEAELRALAERRAAVQAAGLMPAQGSPPAS
ncbi:hypothetical protein TSOC_007586 [Tetrabaena socialis]|uniref:Uncharacterized protein n=1 Tax=Tetrabaena socialis TaxID=47790 RepID=A0A2J8A0P7_9CHLO|nr:hypothetical protein TSOC_007586 [Tetrabaena socialis]|eukprot:PNH06101.1 hypothetical protein TSOC_007586 [Tetrabaena socialis]